MISSQTVPAFIPHVMAFRQDNVSRFLEAAGKTYCAGSRCHDQDGGLRVHWTSPVRIHDVIGAEASAKIGIFLVLRALMGVV